MRLVVLAKMTVAALCRYLNENEVSAEELNHLSKDERAGVRHAVARAFALRETGRRERERLESMLSYERQAQKKGYTYIAGVDEAGRGPLAGPVIAAAVILPAEIWLPGLNDSKLLTPGKREKLFQEITARAVAWSIGHGDVSEIDEINILQATRLAMYRALASLSIKPDFILLDALQVDGFASPQQAIIGGDRLSQSVAAASIVAKVTRDRLTLAMDRAFPGYGFAKHKGYATPEHRQALAELGACPLHRKSFLCRSEEPHEEPW